MQEIRVTGVPEHFNLPWHLAMEEGLFEKEGLKVIWQEEKGGTGAMTRSLDTNASDIAILLTEGIVTAIGRGSKSRILQKYIESPLIWGIHTGAQNNLSTVEELEGRKYAISRKGSGSHLMAQVDAINRDWSIDNEQWNIVGNLSGALEALGNNTAQIFFWEKFTTLPHVKSGELRRVGECVTPWPCFVMAASSIALLDKSEAITKTLDIINRRASSFMRQKDAIELVSKRYSLSISEAASWFYQTEWACTNAISWRMLENVGQTLARCGILEEHIDPNDLCSPFTELNP